MRCPVCETVNPDDALECAGCGKVLATEAELLENVEPLPGLELTLQAPVDAVIEPIAGLEATELADRQLAVSDEVVPGVERTQIEADPAAPLNWVPGVVILDRGREVDLDPRTPAPQDTGSCPWCGAPSTDAVCDNCGRRRSRYSEPPPVVQAVVSAGGDTLLCPACFSRVPVDVRCNECGVPFAPREL